MRLIARHQISDETFRIKSGNDLPTLWRSIGAGKLQSVDRRCITDLARLIKKTVRRHVRIDVNAARGIKVSMMPGSGVDWRLATYWRMTRRRRRRAREWDRTRVCCYRR